ncbi:hypothetical protein C8R44DRAFT_974689 [Mycena epipterygia]|nr:hypothetical protein C8R44DRAFT_974689 [Mycena epipterygia]
MDNAYWNPSPRLIRRHKDSNIVFLLADVEQKSCVFPGRGGLLALYPLTTRRLENAASWGEDSHLRAHPIYQPQTSDALHTSPGAHPLPVLAERSGVAPNDLARTYVDSGQEHEMRRNYTPPDSCSVASDSFTRIRRPFNSSAWSIPSASPEIAHHVACISTHPPDSMVWQSLARESAGGSLEEGYEDSREIEKAAGG